MLNPCTLLKLPYFVFITNNNQRNNTSVFILVLCNDIHPFHFLLNTNYICKYTKYIYDLSLFLTYFVITHYSLNLCFLLFCFFNHDYLVGYIAIDSMLIYCFYLLFLFKLICSPLTLFDIMFHFQPIWRF